MCQYYKISNFYPKQYKAHITGTDIQPAPPLIGAYKELQIY